MAEQRRNASKEQEVSVEAIGRAWLVGIVVPPRANALSGIRYLVVDEVARQRPRLPDIGS